jgi:hypothetical protein
MENGGLKQKATLLTPAGAGLAMICFFLPWIRISCMGTNSYAGADFGGIYWLVFAMAAFIFVAYFVLRLIRRLNRLWVIVSAALLVAVAVIVYGCIMMAGGKRILLVKVGPEDVNLQMHLGGYGTIVGYLLALAGGWSAKITGKSKPEQT